MRRETKVISVGRQTSFPAEKLHLLSAADWIKSGSVKMPSAYSHFRAVTLLGLLFAAGAVLAEEPPDLEIVTTNAFLTNNPAQQKRRDAQRPTESPRQFGVFSPLNTVAPRSFGGGVPSAGGDLFMPRAPVAAPEKDAGKKDWIFARPEDFSAEDAFKVKGFGSKDKDKDKKTLSGFEKFIANDSKSSESLQKQAAHQPSRFDQKSEEARSGNKEDGSKSDTRAFRDDPRRNESLKDFGARNAFASKPMEDRAIGANTKSSIFGEFFRGDSVAQERWAEQASARRNEFQQLFVTKPAADSLPSGNTGSVVMTELSRSAPNGSDPWKNNGPAFSGNRSSFDEASASQAGVTSPSAAASPASVRPQYQPAVLPFPKRPGELFR